jgi:lantibiotic modifying enzyme
MSDARALLSTFVARPPDATALLDMIGGVSGGILALLRLNELTGDESLVDKAQPAAELLVASAQRSDQLARWDNLRAGGFDSGPRPLTGLGHGAAGMGIALLELGHRTGRSDFTTVGVEAFAYEESLLDRTERNWPDLRVKSPSYGIAWCHGAVGIGLTRLRAMQLLGERAPAQWRRDAEMALATTRKALADGDPNGDASLCHGIGGMLELFIVAHEALGDDSLLEFARQTWSRSAARKTPREWTCGVPSGGTTPGLMLGLAGIGWTFLRLHARDSTPSVLI